MFCWESCSTACILSNQLPHVLPRLTPMPSREALKSLRNAIGSQVWFGKSSTQEQSRPTYSPATVVRTQWLVPLGEIKQKAKTTQSSLMHNPPPLPQHPIMLNNPQRQHNPRQATRQSHPISIYIAPQPLCTDSGDRIPIKNLSIAYIVNVARDHCSQ